MVEDDIEQLRQDISQALDAEDETELSKLLAGVGVAFYLMAVAEKHVLKTRRTVIVEETAALADASQRRRVEFGASKFVAQADVVRPG